MDVLADLDAPHPPARVYEVVADLATYPRWLDIVSRAEEDGDAWSVDLRGRLGPFARSKRLRMVRTAADEATHARFERAELDGRSHSAWVLDASIAPHGDGGSRLTMRLHYGGGLWMPVLERLLRDEIERSRPRLLSVLTDG
ncbi:MAG TPA: SRPBCC family protein [Acidimicrobiales bacterium]|nr:SRPBCC family protein [Acidimicrobiales bacterium]